MSLEILFLNLYLFCVVCFLNISYEAKIEVIEKFLFFLSALTIISIVDTLFNYEIIEIHRALSFFGIEIQRFRGIFNRIGYAGYGYAILLFLALYLKLYWRRTKFATFLIVVFLTALILTDSRGGTLAFILILFFYSPNKVRLILLPFLFLLLYFYLSYFYSGNADLTNHRLALSKNYLNLFFRYDTYTILFGTGDLDDIVNESGINWQYGSHNSIIDYLIINGLICFFSGLVFIIILFQKFKYSRFHLCVFGVIFMLCLFEPHVTISYFSPLMLILILITMGSAKITKKT